MGPIPETKVVVFTVEDFKNFMAAQFRMLSLAEADIAKGKLDFKYRMETPWRTWYGVVYDEEQKQKQIAANLGIKPC